MMKGKKKSSGMITIDFLFALIVVFGLSTLLFSLTFTLSVVEVVQYITYSSARSFYAGHLNPEKQIEMGNLKYESLVKNPTFAPLFRAGGWFELQNGPGIAESMTGAYNDLYPPSAPQGTAFYGSRLTLVANIMNIEIPIVGGTGDQPFKANIASYLSREPSDQECMNFMAARLTELLRIDPSMKGPQGEVTETAYFATPDNGC